MLDSLLPVLCFTKQNKCVIAGRSLFDFVRWEASLLTCILKNIIFKAVPIAIGIISKGRSLETYDQRSARDLS